MELRLKDLEISSPAFGALETIPQRYTSDGENISPAIEWAKVPPETKELALICHDPDAPLPWGFTHWVLYNIPADITEIKEGGGDLFTAGVNTSGSKGYTGPAPPPGHGTHYYYFWLYAIDRDLELQAALNREELLHAIADNVIAQARLVGTYQC